MKSIVLLRLLIFLSLLLKGWTSPVFPLTATSSAEEIEVSANVTLQDDNRRFVTCVLTNHSKHILASTSVRSPAKCFRFVLRDKNGEVVPMDEIWAMRHAQPNEKNIGRIESMSILQVQILPGETCRFEFHLEEAYGDRAKEGELLEVTWLNMNSSLKEYSTIWIDELKNPDGTVLRPAREEENHFPGVRTFMVKLPLPAEAADSTLESPGSSRSISEISPDNAPKTLGKQSGHNPPATKTFDRRWLFLLLIPGFALLLRFFRSRKSS